MSRGFLADADAIARVARALHAEADSLNDLAATVPAVPDAGAVSGRMGTLLARQVDAAGEIAIGLGAAGDAVAQGGAVYTNADQVAQQRFGHPR